MPATAKTKPAAKAALKSVPAPNPTSNGKSLEEFRLAHDKNYIIPKKIKEALAKLGSSWEYEIDFVKLAGVSTMDMIRFRDQFESHIVEVKSNGSHKKNVWAGTTEFARKLREAAS